MCLFQGLGHACTRARRRACERLALPLAPHWLPLALPGSAARSAPLLPPRHRPALRAGPLRSPLLALLPPHWHPPHPSDMGAPWPNEDYLAPLLRDALMPLRTKWGPCRGWG